MSTHKTTDSSTTILTRPHTRWQKTSATTINYDPTFCMYVGNERRPRFTHTTKIKIWRMYRFSALFYTRTFDLLLLCRHGHQHLRRIWHSSPQTRFRNLALLPHATLVRCHLHIYPRVCFHRKIAVMRYILPSVTRFILSRHTFANCLQRALSIITILKASYPPPGRLMPLTCLSP